MARPSAAIAGIVLVLPSAWPASADDILAASRRGDVFAVRHYLRKSPDSVGA